jgi:hypothetical protein
MSLAADEVQGDTESALNPFASVWVRFNAKASTAEAAEQKACQTDRIPGTKACRGRKLNIEAGSALVPDGGRSAYPLRHEPGQLDAQAERRPVNCGHAQN